MHGNRIAGLTLMAALLGAQAGWADEFEPAGQSGMQPPEIGDGGVSEVGVVPQDRNEIDLLDDTDLLSDPETEIETSDDPPVVPLPDIAEPGAMADNAPLERLEERVETPVTEGLEVTDGDAVPIPLEEREDALAEGGPEIVEDTEEPVIE